MRGNGHERPEAVRAGGGMIWGDTSGNLGGSGTGAVSGMGKHMDMGPHMTMTHDARRDFRGLGPRSAGRYLILQTMREQLSKYQDYKAAEAERPINDFPSWRQCRRTSITLSIRDLQSQTEYLGDVGPEASRLAAVRKKKENLRRIQARGGNVLGARGVIRQSSSTR